MDFTAFLLDYGAGFITGALWVLGIIGCRRLEAWGERQLKAHANRESAAEKYSAELHAKNACGCRKTDGKI